MTRPNSTTERPRKPKIGRMEAYHTSMPWTHLEVKRSEVTVTRPIYAVIESASYLLNGKAYEVQTWYTDGAGRPISLTSAMTFKVKGQRRKVKWCIWQVLARKSRTKSSRNMKIGRRVVHATHTSFKVKDRKFIRPTNAETESASYLLNGKTSQLLTRYTDGAWRPISSTSTMTSKVKGQGRDVVWWQVLAHKLRAKTIVLQCFDTVGWVIWPVKVIPNMTYNVFGRTLNPTLLLRAKRPINTKIVGRLPTPQAIMHTSSKVKRSKVNVTKPTNAESGSASYLLNKKACELQIWCTDGISAVK